MDRFVQGLNGIQSGGIHTKTAGGTCPWMPLKNSQSDIDIIIACRTATQVSDTEWQQVIMSRCKKCMKYALFPLFQIIQQSVFWRILTLGLNLTFMIDWCNQLYLPASLFLLPLQYFFHSFHDCHVHFFLFLVGNFLLTMPLYSDYTLL